MSRGCGCERGVLRYIKPPCAQLFYPACCIHDDDYDRGGDKGAKKMADRRLFDNCLKIIGRQRASPWKSTWLTLIALLYYASVRTFGRFYFRYD